MPNSCLPFGGRGGKEICFHPFPALLQPTAGSGTKPIKAVYTATEGGESRNDVETAQDTLPLKIKLLYAE